MHFAGIVCVIAVLVSGGLLMILVAQHQVFTTLDERNNWLIMQEDKLYEQLRAVDDLRNTRGGEIAAAVKQLKDGTDKMKKLTNGLKEKTKEADTCQAQLKTAKKQLSEKSASDIQAVQDKESEAWNQEIMALKEQLTAYRPVCDYTGHNPLAVQICGPKPS